MLQTLLAMALCAVAFSKPMIETADGNVVVTLDGRSQQLLIKYADDSAAPMPVAMKADVDALRETVNALQTLVNTKAASANVYTRTEVDNAVNVKANSADVYTKPESDAALALKADATTVYTKMEVDNAIDVKAHADDVYTKTEVDSAVNVKANSADVYTKTESDAALTLKANVADVYTRSEVDSAVDVKADEDKVYSKSEVDTFVAQKADKSSVYTRAQVDDAIKVKAHSDDVYTKTESDAALALKADASSVYTKSEVDTALATKASATAVQTGFADVYSKTEVDAAVSAKANSADVYTKADSDAALALKADATAVYTKAESDSALQTKASTDDVAALKTDVTTGRKVGSFVDDFSDVAAGTNTKWAYYWNPDDDIFNTSAYAKLKYNAETKAWTVRGIKIPNWSASQGPYLYVNGGVVHPGKAKGQSGATADRYSIIGYTVDEAGMYSIRNSNFDLDGYSGDGNSIRVFVNDRLILTHQINDLNGDEIDTFDTFLGTLAVGDEIFVCNGPKASDASDGMSMSFDIEYGLGRALTPDTKDGGRMPFFGGAYFSTVVSVWQGKAVANTWYEIINSNSNILVNQAVYIMKVAPSDLWRVGAGWYDEALVSRPFIWYNKGTNDDDIDPVPVHASGHASNNVEISFRTRRRRGNVGHILEMMSSTSWIANRAMEFTFLRLM
eukprot:TRINITY_DN11316_c0_g1_i4.p1 TRINITY_DN11316_c0_g1~~TRINITY_DN11316_c0_g1_i4.p1  ORF type:complete len:678 (+),score=223.08 TRINITY_DN11316_c0_g1_i4:472-2505(+)